MKQKSLNETSLAEVSHNAPLPNSQRIEAEQTSRLETIILCYIVINTILWISLTIIMFKHHLL